MFNEMMGMFYSGKADAIVTWDIDRLSRNEVDEGTIKWAIRQGKIKEVHTHNSIYTEHELLTMGIFLSLGAEEIAKMRQRVMRRMNSMITEGKVPYLAPYGYSNKDGGAIVNHEEANTLKKIFELRANGYSFGQVADYLNDKGIKSRWRSANSVGKWGSSNVEGIIKNEFYVGVVKFAGQIGEGVHDRIISRDLWDQVNAERRTNVGYKKHDFPLKGIVVNSEGQPLKASLIKGRYVYYHDDKSKIYISQKEIFKELEPLVSKWVFPTEVQIELEKIIRNEINQEYEATIFELNESKKLKSENEAKLSRLINLYSIGGITDVEYQKARLELLAIKSKLDDEENGFTALELSLVEKFNTLVKLLGNLSVAYKTGDDIQRGLILRSALVKLEIDSEKRLQVQQKEVFEDLFKLVECIWLP